MDIPISVDAHNEYFRRIPFGRLTAAGILSLAAAAGPTLPFDSEQASSEHIETGEFYTYNGSAVEAVDSFIDVRSLRYGELVLPISEANTPSQAIELVRNFLSSYPAENADIRYFVVEPDQPIDLVTKPSLYKRFDEFEPRPSDGIVTLEPVDLVGFSLAPNERMISEQYRPYIKALHEAFPSIENMTRDSPAFIDFGSYTQLAELAKREGFANVKMLGKAILEGDRLDLDQKAKEILKTSADYKTTGIHIVFEKTKLNGRTTDSITDTIEQIPPAPINHCVVEADYQAIEFYMDTKEPAKRPLVYGFGAAMATASAVISRKRARPRYYRNLVAPSKVLVERVKANREPTTIEQRLHVAAFLKEGMTGGALNGQPNKLNKASRKRRQIAFAALGLSVAGVGGSAALFSHQQNPRNPVLERSFTPETISDTCDPSLPVKLTFEYPSEPMRTTVSSKDEIPTEMLSDENPAR